MNKRLTFSSYLVVGSMLFGLFFGAGNLIFPVHMGQEAGSNLVLATIGFIITAVGLPFLGVLAIGTSNSDGLFDLASSRIHPIYGYIMTILLYLTIGPLFASPRTATVSFEIGISPYISSNHQALGLAVFSMLFFIAALLFSLKPNQILTWVGKILNPLFLIFIAILIVRGFMQPMGSVSGTPNGLYATAPFFKGFTEGYNTMDALASLAFGIIVVRSLKGLGVDRPRDVAVGTLKSGFVTVVLMAVIYGCLSYLGTTSMGKFKMSDNGGIALTQIAHYYFGTFGGILLAIIVTLACLKTAIGLITACAETFNKMFPNTLSYNAYVFVFTIFSCAVANVGLTQIINLAVPMLMFLYPLAISLIILTLISPIFRNRRAVFVVATLFTLFASFGDALNAMPDLIKNLSVIQNIIGFYHHFEPFYDIGMGWVIPLLVGFIVGLIVSIFKKDSVVRNRI